MKQAADSLYVGDISDAMNLNNEDIRTVLNLSSEDLGKEIKNKREVISINIGFNKDIISLTTFIGAKVYERVLDHEGSLLVACGDGLTKSVAITAGLMSLENKRMPRENVERIRKVKSGVNPHPETLDIVRDECKSIL